MRFWLVIIVLLPFIPGCMSMKEGAKGRDECSLDQALGSSTWRVDVYDSMRCADSLFEMNIRRHINAVSPSNGIWNVSYSVDVTERCVVLGSNTTVVAKVDDRCRIGSKDLFLVIIDNIHVSLLNLKGSWEEPLDSTEPPRLVEHYSGGLDVVNRDGDIFSYHFFDLLRPSSVTTLWEAIKREAVVDGHEENRSL